MSEANGGLLIGNENFTLIFSDFVLRNVALKTNPYQRVQPVLIGFSPCSRSTHIYEFSSFIQQTLIKIDV
ncbi:hypothetical protein KAI32_01080 [Candidatus Pacearchaeota archaeon]|nr:hypothetical protein [Candidatus Pacearchaeota archaeon]